ncbi:MAG TPA: hypothetical protein VF048_01635, partial [Gemmatimonadaceae bacterium]
MTPHLRRAALAAGIAASLAAGLTTTLATGARAQGVAGRAAPDSSRADRAVAAVNALASEYQRRDPDRADSARAAGEPAAPDRGGMPDNSLAALARRHHVEDSLLARLRRVDSAALAGRPEWITYGGLRSRLEASVATRVCHYELWGVNSYVNGWQTSQSDAFSQLAVGTPERRGRARARAPARPGF